MDVTSCLARDDDSSCGCCRWMLLHVWIEMMAVVVDVVGGCYFMSGVR